MENMEKGLTVPKWVLINRSKIPQMPQNFSTQIVCPSPKVWNFDEKRLYWASVVRVYQHYNRDVIPSPLSIANVGKFQGYINSILKNYLLCFKRICINLIYLLLIYLTCIFHFLNISEAILLRNNNHVLQAKISFEPPLMFHIKQE